MLFQRTKHKMNGKKQKIDRKEKERNRSLWGLGSLSSPMGKASEKFSGKVSFCIFFLGGDGAGTPDFFPWYGYFNLLYGYL